MMVDGRAQSPAQTYFYQKDIIATAGKIRIKIWMNYDELSGWWFGSKKHYPKKLVLIKENPTIHWMMA